MNVPEDVLSSHASQLVHRIYAADEALNVDAFLQVLTPDVQFYFGSNPPAQGHGAVRGGVSNLFSMLQGLKHTFIDGWERNNTLVFQAHVTYTHKNGRQITLPYVDILQLEGELVKDYRIYVDPTLLFQQ